MGDVIWKRDLLVDTCTQGDTVGRLAERRLILDQPVEEIGRHDTGETVDVRIGSEPYMLDG
jgi:hypothetical protein